MDIGIIASGLTGATLARRLVRLATESPSWIGATIVEAIDQSSRQFSRFPIESGGAGRLQRSHVQGRQPREIN